MRIAHINVIGGLSTGRIATELCRAAMKEGHRTLFCFARDYCPEDVPSLRIGDKADTLLHGGLARLSDRSGFFSKRATRKLVRQLKEYKPDLIHLHNLHGYYLHLPTLFDYLRKEDIPTVWTLHDCWAFTGHCAYYTMAQNAPPIDGERRRGKTTGCQRWQSGCGKCPLKHLYPKSLFLDQSARNWREKRELFTGLPHLVLTTPSEWLKGQVKQSFLGKYPIYALPNGIDLTAFVPCVDQRYMENVVRHFRLDRYGDRPIVLSVAGVWEPRKGLEDLIELAELLGEDYCVAAVGLDEYQITSLPPNTVVGLPRAGNLNDLCALYTAAQVYVSTSHEETMGMTLVEALACGTQVLCYNATAMPEVVTPQVGETVPLGDVRAMGEAVCRLCAQPKSPEDCRARAMGYDAPTRFAEYIKLYNAMYLNSPGYIRAVEEACGVQAGKPKKKVE
ncbi:MAG: glycosyltransferase [Eubacteriales bacterium]|nr:glycosyltransferase [Eubacteriales bacterium]